MKVAIHEHPITSRIFGIGLPGWLAFAAAGWPAALLVAMVVAALLVWRR